MTPAVIGAAVLAASVSVAITLLWWWLSGQGRHRRRGRAVLLVPRGSAPGDGPYGPEPVLLLDVPPTPSVLRLDGEDQAADDRADTDTVAFLSADIADFAHCPNEGRRTPHFFHRDGSRTCCRCETKTAGDQT